MKLLLSYSWRNVLTRKLTSGLTVFGIGLVVFVFSAVLMLSHGLDNALVSTGSDDNAIVIRKASKTEVQSILDRSMAGVVKADQNIEQASDGTPLFANEILVLISQEKRGTTDASNVPVRGVTAMSTVIRPSFSLVEGRLWQPGTSEIIAGRKVAGGFEGAGMGETVRFGAREWTVVGIFETDNSAFENEIWGDVDQLMDAFGRPVFSSFTMKLKDVSAFDLMQARLEADPRLTVDVRREKRYYADQSQLTTTFINVLGIVISVVFSMGAIVGAMITMYASVAARTKEIGTLRALGFSQPTILLTFLVEAILISVVGGVLGVLSATFLRRVEVSTTNWDTFAEIAFTFELSPEIIGGALTFAIVMGLVGGFLPAVRASRLEILSALRAK